jgi:hypothetical protein
MRALEPFHRDGWVYEERSTAGVVIDPQA